MSAAVTERLVTMANQIARAFETQGGDAARQSAGHIQAFWSPAMREQLVRHLETGGRGLSPIARAAAGALTARSSATSG